jgi:hypothetical protein
MDQCGEAQAFFVAQANAAQDRTSLPMPRACAARAEPTRRATARVPRSMLGWKRSAQADRPVPLHQCPGVAAPLRGYLELAALCLRTSPHLRRRPTAALHAYTTISAFRPKRLSTCSHPTCIPRYSIPCNSIPLSVLISNTSLKETFPSSISPENAIQFSFPCVRMLILLMLPTG